MKRGLIIVFILFFTFISYSAIIANNSVYAETTLAAKLLDSNGNEVDVTACVSPQPTAGGIDNVEVGFSVAKGNYNGYYYLLGDNLGPSSFQVGHNLGNGQSSGFPNTFTTIIGDRNHEDLSKPINEIPSNGYHSPNLIVGLTYNLVPFIDKFNSYRVNTHSNNQTNFNAIEKLVNPGSQLTFPTNNKNGSGQIIPIQYLKYCSDSFNGINSYPGSLSINFKPFTTTMKESAPTILSTITKTTRNKVKLTTSISPNCKLTVNADSGKFINPIIYSNKNSNPMSTYLISGTVNNQLSKTSGMSPCFDLGL